MGIKHSLFPAVLESGLFRLYARRYRFLNILAILSILFCTPLGRTTALAATNNSQEQKLNQNISSRSQEFEGELLSEAINSRDVNRNELVFSPKLSTTTATTVSSPTVPWRWQEPIVPRVNAQTVVKDISADTNGNVYVVGTTINTDPPRDGFMFVEKLDSSGTFKWKHVFEVHTAGSGICAASDGTIYAAGSNVIAKFSTLGDLLWQTSGASVVPIDITCTSGNIYLIGGGPSVPDGIPEAIVAKVNPVSGNLDWQVFLSSNSEAYGSSIVTDSSGNIYVTGYVVLQSRPFKSDAFLARLDATGNEVWFRQLDTVTEFGWDIATNGTGEVFVAGDYSTTVETHGFVRKLDGNGNTIWNVSVGESLLDSLNGIVVDNKGIYIQGSSESAWGEPFESSGRSFVAKLDNNGILQWNTFLGNIDQGPCCSGEITKLGQVLYVVSNISTFPNQVGFVTRIDDLNAPLILVHGIQWLSSSADGYHCTDDPNIDIKRYDPSPSNPDHNTQSTLGPMADWFTNMGYDVWIAHWETWNGSTPSLVKNANCLRKQINYVGELTGQPLTIVAHSMGGVVTRAAIDNLDPNIKVESLYTMGSPHAGFPIDYLLTKLGPILCGVDPTSSKIPFNQQAVCDMTESSMTSFNARYPTKPEIRYNFIGGDITEVPIEEGVLDCIVFNQLQNLHDDCFPGSYSTVGWRDLYGDFSPLDWTSLSVPGQYWTDETHSPHYDPDNNYYSYTNTSQKSDTFQCISALMSNQTPDTQFCQQAISGQTLTDTAEYILSLLNSLNSGGSVSIPVLIDSASPTIFYLSWTGTTAPSFTLARPDTQIIDPGYASANPTLVSYNSFAGSPELSAHAFYKVNSPQIGTWRVNIQASSDIAYKLIVLTESNTKLTVQTDSASYQIGNTATITTHLENNGSGLAGATVTAEITRPDSVKATIPLTDQGNGVYIANYVIPATPGHLTIDVKAFGVSFSRAGGLLVDIAPNTLQLTGPYNANAVDNNSDGKYDSLNFMAGVNLPAAADFAVTADLYKGTQLISHTSDFVSIAAGSQTITLPFDSSDIRLSAVNGPYTVTNLSFTPLDLGIPSAHANNVLTTGFYSYTDFWAPTISGNAGIAGTILSYRDRGVNQTTSSGANGDYSFVVSRNWSGVVNVTKTGYRFAPTGRTYSNVVADRTGQNYVASPIRYTITGNVGIAGATLSYTDVTAKTATSDTDGNYSFTIPYTWSGTVTPSKTGYSFTPNNRTYTNVLSHQINQDYMASSTGGPTATPSSTATVTPTRTNTATTTPTASATATVTPTATPTITQTSSTITLVPIADTYVNAGSTTTNYGTSTTLRADGSPDMHSYLRFNVQGITGPVTNANLRVFANSASSAGIEIHAVNDNTWNESTLTYSNAPSVGGLIGTAGAVATNTWVTVNVTSYITGNGNFNLALITTGSTAISFASRESGANAPQLVIQTQGGPTVTPTFTPTPTPTPTNTGTSTPTLSPTVTPTFTSTATVTSTSTGTTPTATPMPSMITFTSIADTYVNAGSTTTNYGTSTTLRADGSPDLHSYLRFNVQGVSGPVTRATLRVFANSASSLGYEIHAVSDNTWNETTLTYSNAPSVGGLIGSSGAVSTNTWTSVDVTSYISGNGTFNLALITTSGTAISFASRESGANAPQLVIQTQSGPTVTPTFTPTPTATSTISSSTNTPTSTVTSGNFTYSSQPNATNGIDAYVLNTSATTNFGTDVAIAVGESNNATSRIARGLIKFDLSSIPSNATITSATLSLWTANDLSDNDRTLSVYRLKVPFDESQTTWNIARTGVNWQAAGASGTNDRESIEIGSVQILANEPIGVQKQIALSPIKIQEMVNGAFTNNGFIIVTNTELNDRFNYKSSDTTTVSNRPMLIIQYALP